MTGHLFLGGPLHLQAMDLPYDTPRHWDVAIRPDMSLPPWVAGDDLILEPPEIDRFTYVPQRVVLGGLADPSECDSSAPPEATVYVPERMSEDDRWELVKFCGLGQVAEG